MLVSVRVTRVLLSYRVTLTYKLLTGLQVASVQGVLDKRCVPFRGVLFSVRFTAMESAGVVVKGCEGLLFTSTRAPSDLFQCTAAY